MLSVVMLNVIMIGILSLVQSDSYFQPLGVLRHPEKNIFKAYLKK
jgi:hypothetical protein